jgi:hypothetical protein
MKPKATYDLKNNKVIDRGLSVYAGILDLRYKIEVIPQEGKTHLGTLAIYDGKDNDKLIHQEEVTISYGAVFGPDMGDVSEWQSKAIAVIDALPVSSQ